MLDDRSTDLARRTIEVALEERWTPLSRQTLEIASEAIRHGAYGGSRFLVQIIGLYKAELDIQASIAWGHLQRVLANVGIGRMDTLAADLKDFMGETIERVAASLLDHINNSPPFKNKQTNIIEPVKPLNEAKDHALSKVGCEIDLYVAGLEQAAHQTQEGGTTHVSVYGGQVGILQTGNFSSASMTVTLDSNSKREIMAALQAVENTLRGIQETPFDKAEVLELVQDSRAEADKPKPNLTRLKGALLGIAASIQSVAALRPAYETLKGALALVGVTLP